MTTARELAEQLEAIWMSHRFELSDNAMERTEALLQPLVLDAERYRQARLVVEEQAKDEALWCFADSIVEAYVQQELRRLHTAIEGSKS